MSDLPSDDDPPPVPPVQPSLEDCCRSGCEPCIFEIYEEAVERYRAELRAWEGRRTSSGKDTGRSNLL